MLDRFLICGYRTVDCVDTGPWPLFWASYFFLVYFGFSTYLILSLDFSLFPVNFGSIRGRRLLDGRY